MKLREAAGGSDPPPKEPIKKSDRYRLHHADDAGLTRPPGGSVLIFSPSLFKCTRINFRWDSGILSPISTD